MGQIQSLEDLLNFLTRRRWLIMAVAALGIVLAAIYAKSRPDSYEAAAVIEVQSAQVGDAGTSGSAQLLQSIEQRLTSRENLAAVIDRHGLYSDLPALSMDERIALLRRNVTFQAIAAAGLPVREDAGRGLDHGAWIPLRLMFPEAEVPVIPLSIQSQGGPQQAYLLGQALTPLTDQGFLLIASGNVTHNLRDYQLAARNGGQTPAYVRQFSDWLADRLEARDIAALLDYRRQAPGALQAHPSEEHLLPFFVALGAGGDEAMVRRFHAGIDDYVLAMDAFSFHRQPGGQA